MFEWVLNVSLDISPYLQKALKQNNIITFTTMFRTSVPSFSDLRFFCSKNTIMQIWNKNALTL